MKYIFIFFTFLLLNVNAQVPNGVIYFEVGSSVPEKEEILNINSILSLYNKGDFESIKIIGYADTTSNWAYNLNLSQKRASKVKSILIEKGIPSHQIQTIHKGESESGDNLKHDRRVEIYFQKSTLTLKQLLEEQDAPIQYFSIQPEKDNELTCSQGTVLQIPKDCFVNDKGEVITAPINFQIQEYYNLGDYLKKGMYTTSTRKEGNNSELLQSGGVINFKATSQGKKIYFNQGMKLGIGFNSPADSKMMAFIGRPNEQGVSWFEDLVSKLPGRGIKGTEIWTKDSVLMHVTDEKGRKLPLDTTLTGNEIKTYRFIDRLLPSVYVNDFGFINCDKFWNDPTAVEMQETIELSHFSEELETMVYLLFQKTMSLLPMQRNQLQNNKTVFQSPRMKMPYGSSAHIIAIHKNGDNLYLGVEAIELKGDKTTPVEFYKATLQDLTEILSKYKMN